MQISSAVGILKNHLNQITLLNKCDQTTPKFNYKVLLERWHPFISVMPLDWKVVYLTLLQPGAKQKMSKKWVICPYRQRSLDRQTATKALR